MHPLAVVVGLDLLIKVLVVLIVVGVALWLVDRYIPMDPPIKILIRVVVILVIVLWLLRVFGIV